MTGTVESGISQGTLFINGEDQPFGISGGAFSAPVRLGEGTSAIVACVHGDVCSDTLRYTLGYELAPEGSLRATAAGRTVTLSGAVLRNPGGAPLTHSWTQHPDNPQSLTINPVSDSAATVAIPEDAPLGEYYFGWQLKSADGDAMTARTFVTVDSTGVHPFDMADDYAAWVDKAVIYQVPSFLLQSAGPPRFYKITAKIPEIAALGANVLWLQPVYPYFNTAYPNALTQGYAVTNYFELSHFFFDPGSSGARAQLRELVGTAHEYGMKVLFDFVAKHTSIRHDYAQDAIEHGSASHYYDFYMREPPIGTRYAYAYGKREVGRMTFVSTFEGFLVDLNYDNPEVERWIIEATRYWVEEFDIDGYRFDAIWAVAERDPAFLTRLRSALKRVKPSIFLLAEAKATNDALFDGRFDAAYDWTDNDDYISDWAWQRSSCSRYDYTACNTLFNSGVETYKSRELRNALTNEGRGYSPDAKILRFLENNDVTRFGLSHDFKKTRMAAALLFSLPGIPMLYFGQEVGTPSHQFAVYLHNTIRSYRSFYDDNRLWWFYQDLIATRKHFPALYSDNFAEVDVAPGGIDVFPDDVDNHVFSYRRWEGGQNIFGVINMGSSAEKATLLLPVDSLDLQPDGAYYFTDLLTGASTEYDAGDFEALEIDLDAYSTRLFILSDAPVEVPSAGERPMAAGLPQEIRLKQNYPNPFSNGTTIRYALTRAADVRLAVYDVLGRQVAVLVDGRQAPGWKSVHYEAATRLPSGLYFYRLRAGENVSTRKMVRVR